jgi:hypothetical protein
VKVWGSPIHKEGFVTVRVLDDDSGALLSSGSAVVDANGTWVVSLTSGVPARNRTTVTALLTTAAATGAPPVSLQYVAWGDVLLCGGAYHNPKASLISKNRSENCAKSLELRSV